MLLLLLLGRCGCCLAYKAAAAAASAARGCLALKAKYDLISLRSYRLRTIVYRYIFHFVPHDTIALRSGCYWGLVLLESLLSSASFPSKTKLNVRCDFIRVRRLYFPL